MKRANQFAENLPDEEKKTTSNNTNASAIGPVLDLNNPTTQ
jgi:hypothetical protein